MKRLNNLFRLFALCSIILFSASIYVMAAGKGEEDTAEKSGKEDIVEFNIYNWGFNQVPDNRLLEYVQDKFNLKLNIESNSWGEWQSKLNIKITAGDIPDIFPTKSPGEVTGFYNRYVDEGILYDMTDVIKRYPNMKQQASDPSIKFLYTNGRIYGFPRRVPSVASHVNAIRTDWLEEVGMEMPANYDELYQVLKAFKEADLGLNGFSGWMIISPWWLQHNYMNWIGAWKWGIVDGKYVHNAVRDGYKESLKYFNKLYEEGLLDPDMFLGKGDLWKDKLASGQTGVSMINAARVQFDAVYEALKKNEPNSELELFVPPLEGPAGRYCYRLDSAYWTMTCFRKDIENADRAFELIDWLCSDDGIQFAKYGIKGIHYNVVDGEVVQDIDEWKADGQKVNDIYMMAHLGLNLRWYNDVGPIIDGELINLQEGLDPYAVRTKVVGFTSEEYTQLQPIMDDVFSEYQAKFITGELDIEEHWDEYINAYRESGYDVIEKQVQDYMEQYE